MPWVKIDDRFTEHPKIAALSDSAVALFVAALCYCNRNLSDGHVAEHVALGQLRYCGGNALAAVRELEVAGLLERSACGGWTVHDFHDYQPTKQQVISDRLGSKERMRKSRAGRVAPTVAPTVAPHVAPTVAPQPSQQHIPKFGRSSPAPVPVPVPSYLSNLAGERSEPNLAATRTGAAPPSPPPAAPAPGSQANPDPDFLPMDEGARRVATLRGRLRHGVELAPLEIATTALPLRTLSRDTELSRLAEELVGLGFNARKWWGKLGQTAEPREIAARKETLTLLLRQLHAGAVDNPWGYCETTLAEKRANGNAHAAEAESAARAAAATARAGTETGRPERLEAEEVSAVGGEEENAS